MGSGDHSPLIPTKNAELPTAILFCINNNKNHFNKIAPYVGCTPKVGQKIYSYSPELKQEILNKYFNQNQSYSLDRILQYKEIKK